MLSRVNFSRYCSCLLRYCALGLFTSTLFTSHVAANPVSIDHINLTNPNYKNFLASGFKPRKDVPAWPIKLPIDWDTDPFDDRNWRFQLHAWRLIDPYLRAYHRNKDKAELDKAVEIIADWYDFHIDQKQTSGMQWYDMSTGLRAMKLAWLWGEIGDNNTDINENDQAKIKRLMEIHIEKLLDQELLSTGNHGYFQLVGLRLLCNNKDFSTSCKNEEEYNDRNIMVLLKNQFTAQGIHRENAPYYHHFALNTLNKLNVEALYGSQIAETVQQANKLTPWMLHPDKSFARIGDSEGKLNLKTQISDKPQTINDSEVLIGDFIDSGYFILRTPMDTPVEKATQLFISGTSNLEYDGHKHADELSFELFHKGKLVILDSGKYSYNDNPHRKYVLSAQAHNTLSLENIRVSRRDVEGSGSKLSSYKNDENIITVNGSVTRPGLFTQKRTFKISPFDKIIISDTFTSHVPWTEKLKNFSLDTVFTSNLHLHPELKVNKSSDRSITVDDYANIELITTDCKLNVVTGQKDPLLGWASFAYNEIGPTTVLQARCPVTSAGEATWSIILD